MKFEIVSKYINSNGEASIHLPVRATANSAGYDFEAATSIIVPSYLNTLEEFKKYTAKKIPYYINDIKTVTKMTGFKPTLVPTGIKCKLDKDHYLEISVRSSTPLNTWMILANGIGIIDSDYYNNPDNEGEIFFQLINLSPVDIVIQEGDKIGQGIIKRYEKTEDDNASGERGGGFGSTTK